MSVNMHPYRIKIALSMLLVITTLFFPNLFLEPDKEFSLDQQVIPSADGPLFVEQIFINGNSEFHLKVQEYGWPGDGTAANPILVEHMNFSKNANMFAVSNTDLHFQFSNNRLDGIDRSWCAIVLYNVTNAIISDNYIVNAAVGVHAIKISQSLITNNHVYRSGVGVIIEHNSHENVISSNYFDDLIECGVWSAGYSHHNLFYGNEINGAWEGFNIGRNSVYNTISNNLIYNCDNYGVWLMTENNSVLYNEIHSISGNGVSVWNSGNEVIGNLIYNNSDCGIVLRDNADHTIVQNNTIIWNSQWGLVIDSGYDITIKNNDFIDNEEPDQVCDDGDSNTFAGNYWHMWIGADSDVDNVIDNPNPINGSAISVDNVPSVSPNTQLPDWYSFSPVIPISLESTSSVTEYEETSTDTDNLPIELILGIGLLTTGIPVMSLIIIKKRRV